MTGQEINSIVLDVGSYETKAGYSGFDTPTVVLPSFTGKFDGKVGKCQHFCGDATLNNPKAQISEIFKDGQIDNWNALETLLDHVFECCLNATPSTHPILFSEYAWTSRQEREKLTQIFFEKYQVPAYFVAKDAVLTAFAAGKSTALVLSSGAQVTRAVPVSEGYVLKKGIMKQSFAGDAVSDYALQMIKQELKQDVVCSYQVASKEQVEPNHAPKWQQRKVHVHPSYHKYQTYRLAQDFKESVCQVSEAGFDINQLNNRVGKSYEFPNGFNTTLHSLRFQIPEILFTPTSQENIPIHQLVNSAIQSVDVDLRPTLYSNIILQGGNTNLNGFGDRLQHEIYNLNPSVKVKVGNPSTNVEKKYLPWTGGSILSSLGTFHQLWISKQEYEDVGSMIVEKRCM